LKQIKIAVWALCILLFSGAIALSEGFYTQSGEIAYFEEAPRGYEFISERLILGEGEIRIITNEAKYFASDDPDIVFLDEHGVLQAIAAGKGLISVYLEENIRKDLEIEVRPAPKSIKLGLKKTTLTIGETKQLTATLTKSSACTLTWYSSSPNIVDVDDTGLLTALGEGTCTITARTHNGLTAECAVTVELPAPAEIDLITDTVTVYMGETASILYTLEGGYNETVAWSINDESIAIIDENGVLTAVSPGKTVAGMEASGGDVRFIDVFVQENATNLSFPAHEVTMYTGGRTIVDPVIEGGSGKYEYVSMDTSIAEIDPETGEICALRAGSVYILGVTPNFTYDEFLLTIIDGPDGLTLTPEKNEIATGEAISTFHNLDGFEPLYTWYESSDEKIAHVDEYGVVTGLEKGTVVISIHSGGFVGKAELTVLPPAEKITAYADRSVLAVGETAHISHDLFGGTGEVEYSLSDMYVAQVDAETGTIYALSPGTCEITLSISKGVSTSIEIEVFPAPESVHIEKESYTILAGNRCPFSFGINEGALTTFDLTSSNPDLVWYEDGYLMCANLPGSAFITVSTHNGYKVQAEITVIPEPDQIALSANKLTKTPDFDYYLVMSADETHALNAYIENVPDVEIFYTASHPDIASVTDTGIVTAHKKGTSLINVSLYSGFKTSVLICVE